MLRIGGQRVPPKTLLMVASDVVLIVLGLLMATALRFLSSGTVRLTLHARDTFWRFALVVIVC